MMINFRQGELVETTANYISKEAEPGQEKIPKKKFGIIVEPKIEMVSLNDTPEDYAALVQWADNSEEKVFHYEIEKVIK